MSRFAIPIAIAVGVASFLAALLLFHNAYWDIIPSIGLSIIVGFLILIGVLRLLDPRTEQQLESDTYVIETEHLEREVLRQIDSMHAKVKQLRDTKVEDLLVDLRGNADAYVQRIPKDSLLSSIGVLKGYTNSLEPLVEQYADITRYPRYYDDPVKQQEKTRNAIRNVNAELSLQIKEGIKSDQSALTVHIQMLDALKYKRLDVPKEEQE